MGELKSRKAGARVDTSWSFGPETAVLWHPVNTSCQKGLQRASCTTSWQKGLKRASCNTSWQNMLQTGAHRVLTKVVWKGMQHTSWQKRLQGFSVYLLTKGGCAHCSRVAQTSCQKGCAWQLGPTSVCQNNAPLLAWEGWAGVCVCVKPSMFLGDNKGDGFRLFN